jgi:predicted RNA-binding protein (virulence factor B family)
MGEALVPVPSTVVQEGDVLHVMVTADDKQRVAGVLADRGTAERLEGDE